MVQLDVTVVIPTHNRCEKLIACLRSVLSSSDPPSEIIVVDDASDDGTREMLTSDFTNVRLIRHDRPTYAAGCINDGIRSASSEHVLIIDDDNVIHPDMIRKLHEFAQMASTIGVVGPVTYYKSEPKTIMYTGAIFTPYLHRTIFIGKDEPDSGQFNSPFMVSNIPNCFLVKRSIALEVGLIDSEIFVWTGEDGSLQDKILLHGYSVWIVPGAMTFHDIGKNDRSDSIERISYSKLYYMMRSKTSHILLIEPKLLNKIIRLMTIPIFLSFATFRMAYLVRKPKDIMKRFRYLLKGTIDGLFLKRGLPFQ